MPIHSKGGLTFQNLRLLIYKHAYYVFLVALLVQNNLNQQHFRNASGTLNVFFFCQYFFFSLCNNIRCAIRGPQSWYWWYSNAGQIKISRTNIGENHV